MKMEGLSSVRSMSWLLAVFALVTLFSAQWLLSSALHGSNYYGVDGKMVQTTALTMFRFGGFFQLNNINPLEGVGSQLLPKNAWANPSFWPFGFLDKEAATDLSALIALAVFAISCYVMARSFDVPVVPSALAAQACIVLFAPLLLLVYTPTNFCLTPSDAVVYAPYMIAFGMLVRVEPSTWRAFATYTAVIVAALFYSLYCDPLWTMVAGISWATPFAVVAFAPLRLKRVLLRVAALSCYAGFLIITGMFWYLFTISQYTARVYFPEVVDRVRSVIYVSSMTYSPNMKYFYFACAAGWLLGLLTLRGRERLLVLAGVLAFSAWLIYSAIYLILLNAVWVGPIPIYIEQCLFPLYLTAALAGAWGLLRTIWRLGWWILVRLLGHTTGFGLVRGIVAIAAGILLTSLIPAAIAKYAIKDAAPWSETYNWRWPPDRELPELFESTIGLTQGQPFRGSVNFLTSDSDTGTMIAELWSRRVPTFNEYSQLMTPPALYFVHKIIDRDVRAHLNHLTMYWRYGTYSARFWDALEVLGVRYSAERWPLPDEFNPGFPLTTEPYRPQDQGQVPGFWYVYELPHPNVGNYTPTEVIVATSADDTMVVIKRPSFDFMKQVVLLKDVGTPLVPAHDMRLSPIRGGWHVTGKSDGTSLVVLPQQFSHCLRAHDPNVRLVRADLLISGLIFSGEVDTDILFDYGMFSQWCRRADLAELHEIDLKIDLRMQHLTGDRFPNWAGAVTRLRAAVAALN